MKNYIIRLYKTKSGKELFTDWLSSLKDRSTSIKIMRRIRRLELGNLGNYKSLASNLYELKFSFGAGYRVYYTIEGEEIIILLCGGDKSSQSKDIKKAKEILEEIENDK